MRLGVALAGVAVGLVAVTHGTTAGAQPVLRAVCTKGGQIVHREDLPPGAGYEEKATVTARNPDALCVFVQNDDSEKSVRYGLGPSPTAEVPRDSDLATALAMISEGRQSPNDGEKIPVDLSAIMQPIKATPTVSSTINLTIGIYKDMEAADIIDHWKAMQRDSQALKNLTPTLTRANDITMLSVENVPDALADQLCKEAEKTSSGCLAYY